MSVSRGNDIPSRTLSLGSPTFGESMLKTPGILDIVADLGLTGGPVDCYPDIQSAINRYLPNLIRFPQKATYTLGQPLIIDNPLTWIECPARGIVILRPVYGKINPIFMFGLRQNESGNTVTSANRPDCYGVLDRSFVSAVGLLSGFRTLGTSFLLANAHPVQIGQRSQISGDHTWDYWSECLGTTIEFAIQANKSFQPDDCLFCWGSHQFQPAPFCVTVAPDGSGRFAVAFKTADMSPLWNTSFAIFYGGNANTTSLTRVQVWIDFITGTVGIIQDGSPQNVQWITPIPKLLNNRFQRNRGQYSFSIGSDIGVQSAGGFTIPDFTVFGFRVSNVARKTYTISDGSKYLNDPNTIAYLPGSGPPLRSLDLSSGAAADSYVGTAWIVPAKISGGGIKSGGLRNLIIQGGSPSAVNAATLGLTIDNCEIDGYHQAIGNLPILASYPVKIRDSILSGGDTAVSFWRSSVSMRENVIERGGITSIRSAGCNLHSWDDRIAFTTGGQETAVEMFQDQYGGCYDITNIDIDSESDNPFSAAVFRIETHPYTSTRLTISRPNISGVGPNATIVTTIGHAVTPGVYNPAKILMDMPVLYTNTYLAAVNAGVGWNGTVDLQFLGNQQVVGAGASGIKVITSANPVNP